MNEIIFAILFGSIQGLTEFLPISSSAHLAIFRFIADIQLADPLAFDVSLHVGSLLALICYFHNDIIYYIKGCVQSIVKKQFITLQQRMWIFILIATIPALIVGALLSEIFVFFQSVMTISLFLVLGGIAFIITENVIKPNKSLEHLTVFKSLLIGCFQVLALMPGISRSGITILTGMWLNFSRHDAARFSFLMGIPILFAAGVKKGYDMFLNPAVFDAVLFIMGFMTSFIVSFLVISFFLSFVKRYSLKFFGYYRIILGLILFMLWMNSL